MHLRVCSYSYEMFKKINFLYSFNLKYIYFLAVLFITCHSFICLSCPWLTSSSQNICIAIQKQIKMHALKS